EEPARLVLIGERWDFVRRWKLASDPRLAGDDHDVPAATITVEVQRDLWVAFDVPQLLLVRLAVDQNGPPGPQKPARARLWKTVGTDAGQPYQVVVTKPPLGAPAEIRPGIK